VFSHSLALRSPDLIPLDIFFWEFVKEIVYREKVKSVNEFDEVLSGYQPGQMVER
jgi:hypothetical protein